MTFSSTPFWRVGVANWVCSSLVVVAVGVGKRGETRLRCHGGGGGGGGGKVRVGRGEVRRRGGRCVRVPVLNGHTAAVFINFEKKPTKEQLIEKLVNFKGFPQEAELPSAPKQFIQYLGEDNRPQVTLDVDYEHGMGVSIGRLREDTMYDYKFIGLSHNTVRGAAGGAVLCAEALTAKGYIAKK